MANYASKVRQDIMRWRQAGLVDAATAATLLSDVEANERRALSFGAILAMMAALLLGAAILIFVAANWEAIPRLARVLLLFAVILAGYVGGALLKLRGQAAAGEALWIVAAAAFGGSIALVGQMYHLPGDETSALVTWGIGTAVAAVALRSNPLTVAAVGIADAWLVLKVAYGFDMYRSFAFPHLFVVMAAALYGISFWTRSQQARHLIMLSLILYAVLLALDHDTLAVAIGLAVLSAAAFAAAVAAPEPVERIVGLGGRLPLHGFIGFLTALVIIQFDRAAGSGFGLAAAVALAGIAAAIVFGGRESRGLRWLAYLGFAFELLVIYGVMMETMLGTAGFFLAAALILGLLAFVIIRVERRMAGVATQAGAVQ